VTADSRPPRPPSDRPEPAGGGTAGVRTRIVVNGEPHVVDAGTSAAALVALLGLADRPLAVEVNERIVPRRDLAACMLHDGDRIEIVTLVGGG